MKGEITIEFLEFENKYEDYLKDESRLKGKADYIAFPESIEDIIQLVLQAQEKGIGVTIQGANTGIVGGSVPNGGSVLNLEKLNQITGIDKTYSGEYILNVQAGATLGEVKKLLSSPKPPENWSENSKALFAEMKSRGEYYFPPNPTETTATMGGLYATNASGANVIKYGRVADHIASAKLVSPQGELWELDKDMVCEEKNTLPTGEIVDIGAKGEKLISALSGSEGKLYIAAELGIILKKKPEYLWGIHYFFEDFTAAKAFIQFLSGWQKESAYSGFLSTAEYYDEPSLRLITASKENVSALKNISDFPTNTHYSIYVELESDNDEDLETAIMEQFEGFILSGGKEEDTWAADSAVEVEKFRDLRHALPEVINTNIDIISGNFPEIIKTACDYTGAKEKAAEYACMYKEDIERSGLEGFVFGHMLESHYHVNLLPKNLDELTAAQKLINQWADVVVTDGGSLVSENGIGRIKRNLIKDHMPWYAEKLAKVKSQIDPQDILK